MAYQNGGQSQYFQSFDVSQFTNPSNDRRRPCPSYTAQQKDEAIHLLNDGYPAKMIAAQVGGSCSKANPYRWRAEELERERQRQEELERWRRLEDEQRERDRVAAAWAQRHRDMDWFWLIFPLMIVEAVAIFLIGHTPHMVVTLLLLWNLWVVIIFIIAAILELWDNQIRVEAFILRMHFYTCEILWLYVIYHFQIAPILFPKPEPEPKPWYHF